MSKKEKILKECDGLVCEFVRNSKGTLIKICCASCKHKQPYDPEGPRRLCVVDPDVKNKIVYKDSACADWEISSAIDDIVTASSKPVDINND